MMRQWHLPVKPIECYLCYDLGIVIDRFNQSERARCECQGDNNMATFSVIESAVLGKAKLKERINVILSELTPSEWHRAYRGEFKSNECQWEYAVNCRCEVVEASQ